MTYNQKDAFAYGMLDLIGTFVARVSLDKDGLARLKELVHDYCGGMSTSSRYGRAIEASIGQFIASVEEADKL